MSVTYTFPTNSELDVTTQEYMPQADNLMGAEFLPVETTSANTVRWEEEDSVRGMTAAHNLGDDPTIDNREGSVEREFKPLYFKETDVIGEKEMTEARELGTYGQPIDLSRMVAKVVKRRMDKTMLRVEWTRWMALRGRLQYNENGIKVDETFPVQQHTILTEWDQYTTALPLNDLDTAMDKFEGKGASREGAVIVMNSQTLRFVLRNQNDSDLKAFQNSNFVNVRYSLAELNKIVQDRTQGATIKLNDEGYIDKNGVYQKFVGLGDVHIIGKRPRGEKIGAWKATRSLHKQEGGYFNILEVNGKPSMGATSISESDLAANKNPKIENTGGIYGGPVMKYGRSAIYFKAKT